MKTNDNIEIYSDVMQDIISRPPRALIRYGISIIGGIILLIFVGIFFFHYPDVIQSEVVITTENPPVWIIARSTGNLKEIFYNDREAVRSGSLIAVMENSANTEDVLKIKEQFSCFQVNDSILSKIPFFENLKLGSIQSAYASLIYAYNEYFDFHTLQIYDNKIQAVKNQIIEYQEYKANIQQQINFSSEAESLVKKDFDRSEHLYSKKIISELEFENSQKVWLSARQATNQMYTNLATVKLEEMTLKKTLIELELQKKQELNRLKINLQSALDNIKVSIKNWEQNYLLISPANGILSYNEFWKENQNINIGDKTFSVVSENQGRIIGKVKTPIEGAGKIKKGQKAHIKLSGYPYMEYGFLIIIVR
jgi:HlyD family secretion protein